MVGIHCIRTAFVQLVWFHFETRLDDALVQTQLKAVQRGDFSRASQVSAEAGIWRSGVSHRHHDAIEAVMEMVPLPFLVK